MPCRIKYHEKRIDFIKDLYYYEDGGYNRCLTAALYVIVICLNITNRVSGMLDIL